MTDLVGFHSKYCPWGKVASEAVVSCLKILFAFLFFLGFIVFYHVLYILFIEVFLGIRTSVHNNSSLEWEISGRPASSSCCRCQAIWLPSLGQDTSRELAGASPQQELLGRGGEGRGVCEEKI